jgi:hypothetical protein
MTSTISSQRHALSGWLARNSFDLGVDPLWRGVARWSNGTSIGSMEAIFNPASAVDDNLVLQRRIARADEAPDADRLHGVDGSVSRRRPAAASA